MRVKEWFAVLFMANMTAAKNATIAPTHPTAEATLEPLARNLSSAPPFTTEASTSISTVIETMSHTGPGTTTIPTTPPSVNASSSALSSDSTSATPNVSPTPSDGSSSIPSSTPSTSSSPSPLNSSSPSPSTSSSPSPSNSSSPSPSTSSSPSPSNSSSPSPSTSSSPSPSNSSSTSPSNSSSPSPSNSSSTSPSTSSSTSSSPSPSNSSSPSPSNSSSTSPLNSSSLSPSTTSSPSPSTTSPPSPLTSSSPNSSTPSFSSTSVHSMTTVSPTSSSTSAWAPTSPPGPVFLINEFTYSGLFADGKSFFVEVLKLSGPADSVVSVVVLTSSGGGEKTCLAVLQLDQGWTNGTQVKNANLAQSAKDAVYVGLFYNASEVKPKCSDNGDMNKLLGMADDVMIVSKGQNLDDKTTLHNLTFRALVASENKLKNLKNTLSVSRCENTTKDPGAFILTKETKGKPNDCLLQNEVNVKMTLNATNCSVNKDPATQTKLKNYMAKTVGDTCACGFSPYMIKKVKFECKCLTYTWSLSAATEDQKVEIKSQYDAMIELMTHENSCFENSTLCIGPLSKDCDHLPPGKKDNDNKIKVTIGVVVGCIVIFLLIVAVVIIYIRRKRRGILQFRMTRLDEDDDDLMIGPDTDDFIGGQDASFSNPTYSRFK